ncbi:WbqC-like protein [Herbaspirillum hiltneri N3]|uniref:WbqC-like protein n=1 Tax=Herbaspirillum hiltneri N3 TaxID=1262470 RepID=A0ABN4I121_9BURK|nr:WbqC family protein [Herbaspirillum hiltneri]AKZ64639.1 WbqC-like protein [Herbaspirillum hiltneri N3]
MTRLAIMQPYFFPYIGYWQLIQAADRFVIYDDVNYINRGWINRNRLLINGEPTLITLPLRQASQNKKICDIDIAPTAEWLKKMLRMVEVTYKKAPYFNDVFPVIEGVLTYERSNLADYLAHHLQTMASFMEIETEFVVTSRDYANSQLAAQERIIDIARREQADVYINAQGGKELYDAASFSQVGIDLRFIAMRPLPYPQRGSGFTPYLSIIDALMEVGPKQIRSHLDAYDYV